MKIVAHGDSWLDYDKILLTGGSIVDHLERIINQPIINLAHHGDGSQVSMSLPKRKALEAALPGADYLLVSSGGDDIAGDQFCIWLTDNTGNGVETAIDKQRFNAALALIQADYEDMALVRNEFAPNCIMVTHEYDLPPANVLGHGVCGLGPWMKPSLDYCGWTDPKDQVAIITAALQGFARMIAAINIPNRIHVATQGTLGWSDWSNEIHPNRNGFELIARKIAAKLDL